MKKKVLWVTVALMTAIGFGACSSDDENDNSNLRTNMLQISNSVKANTRIYAVPDSKFYIDMMPSDKGPGVIFHCDIKESPDIRALVIRMSGVGVKSALDAFQVGETFLLNQFNASLVPIEWCGTTPAQFRATNGTIKLVEKKKSHDKDVLTFQINNLFFEQGYAVTGAVDFEYEGIVY